MIRIFKVKILEKVMDKRNEKRYSISEYLDNIVSKEDCTLEFDCNGVIIAKSVDISMSGIGFEISDIESAQIEAIQNNDGFYIKIYIAKEVLFADAKKIWSAVVKTDGETVLKGGLTFSVISPEDRIKLSKFIEEIWGRI